MESTLWMNCSYLQPLMLQSSEGYRYAFCFFYYSSGGSDAAQNHAQSTLSTELGEQFKGCSILLVGAWPTHQVWLHHTAIPSRSSSFLSPWSPIHPSHHACSYIFKHILGHVKQHLQGLLVLAGKSEHPSMMLQPRAPVSLHAPRSHNQSPQGFPSSIGCSVTAFPRIVLPPPPPPPPSEPQEWEHELQRPGHLALIPSPPITDSATLAKTLSSLVRWWCDNTSTSQSCED